ncbi:hypothetical protein BUALT_Bualt19G0014200 [Buddleja alternifolia]|uniref:D-isomer specific 2-hydroxyacid dehydrogenase NAD-binding domain-containing protein n=1 Tax=Buddleja alternifolia TaxID=168488 RepID=A0AAV6W163_9LAMI|nr:hypothetical protein BUALT_Bualt19G0014200 [Buddleja alternifolia]
MIFLILSLHHLFQQLGGKKVGIVGLGSIGLEVAKRFEAFGCTISCLSRTKNRSIGIGNEGALVYIARGAVIDEKDLVYCLQCGEIAGAGLDMFENEHRVPNEISELDNVVLSPHCAIFTEESFRDSYELMCGHLEAFFSNKSLLSLVAED